MLLRLRPEGLPVDHADGDAGRTVAADIGYVYDPVGNVVQSTDAAEEGAGALIDDVTVPAAQPYPYDADYRLPSATGRVHEALLSTTTSPG